jgi:hypothetical protein
MLLHSVYLIDKDCRTYGEPRDECGALWRKPTRIRRKVCVSKICIVLRVFGFSYSSYLGDAICIPV